MGRIAFRLSVLFLLISLIVISLYRKREYNEIVSHEAIRPILIKPVSVLPVVESSPTHLIRSAGKVASTNQAIVVSRVNGVVESVFIQLGSTVKKGQKLLTVDDQYLEQQYQLAARAYRQDLKDYERLISLSDVEAVTQQQLEQFELKVSSSKTKMELAKKRFEETVIRATVDGVINQIMVKRGDPLGEGSPVCQIVGKSAKTIQTGFSLEEAGLLSIGDRVRLLDKDIIYPFEGRILSIGTSKGFLGQVSAEVQFSAFDQLDIDQLVDLEVEVELEKAIYIPRHAVLKDQDHNYVMLNKRNSAQKEVVLVGAGVGNNVEISEGIAAGDSLILKGKHLLNSGDSVKIVEWEKLSQ
ncbi:MAG: efflux RND transporter periplasmic adaptor subunit [Bacteroidota bacterium]